MEALLTNLIQQLEPISGLLILILLVAVFYLWKGNLQLQSDKDKILAKKDEDLKDITTSKDNNLKEMTQVVIELQEKTIVSNEKLANNISANTEATQRVEVLISNYNLVLNNMKKVKNG